MADPVRNRATASRPLPWPGETLEYDIRYAYGSVLLLLYLGQSGLLFFLATRKSMGVEEAEVASRISFRRRL